MKGFDPLQILTM